MIVVDTSAICAVLFGEVEKETVMRELHRGQNLISAATWLELHIVMHRRNPKTGLQIIKNFSKSLPADHRLKIRPFNKKQADAAMIAAQHYSSGKYALNYGDFMSYALAKTLNLPLLYKGKDFSLTDLKLIEA